MRHRIGSLLRTSLTVWFCVIAVGAAAQTAMKHMPPAPVMRGPAPAPAPAPAPDTSQGPHPAGNGGQFNVVCNYSHTLPDDAIFWFGQPGYAMIHDFFGSSNANASISFAKLRASPSTSCDAGADRSAYWTPALRRGSGEIIRPYMQKTYYTALGNLPVTSFPEGFGEIVGDHQGVAPNPLITFGCLGHPQTWSTTMRSSCPIVQGKRNTFTISLLFPNCWDGKHLLPSAESNNVAWAGENACPADYPVRLPRLWMQVHYDLGQNGDLSGAQLSLDPVLKDGKLVEQWGSMYTAHADFYNGWSTPAMRYMVKNCLNADQACNKDIPLDYRAADSDTYVSHAEPNASHGAQTRANVSTAAGNERIALIRFPLDGVPADGTYKQAQVRLFGEAEAANETVYLRTITDDWNEQDATWNHQPACSTTGPADGSIFTTAGASYRKADVTAAVKTAIAAGKKSIAFCVTGPWQKDTRSVWFSTRETDNPPLLFFQ